jgi:ribosome-associated protein
MLPLIVLSNSLELKPEYLSFTCERSSGPGGQNVNKVSSKVRLRFDLESCDALDATTRERLRQRYARRLDADGALVITSQITRDQRKNLHDAIERLTSIVNAALVPITPRKPTKPSRAAKARRLSEKRQQSRKKALRRVTRESAD